ncbi:MAG: hypothetical protein AB1Z98_19895 [Nannocystaceae bacterium]
MSDDEVKDPEPSEGSETGSETADAPADDSAASASSSRPSRRKRRSRPADSASDTGDLAAAEAVVPSTTALATVSDAADAKADDGDRRDLPKWNRARVKRKAPKGEEEDAFQSTVRKAGRGVLQRPAVVIGLIVAAAGIGTGVYYFMQAGEGERAQATSILATAAAYEARGQVIEDLATVTAERKRPLPFPYVESEDALRGKVDAALSDLEAQASDSPANEVADLMRAARLARVSDFEGAEKAYRSFVQRLPGHRLLFMAREGLVLALEGQKRWDDALTELEPLMGIEGDFYRDQALWHRARLLEGAERTDEALEVYKQYMAEYPLDTPSLAADEVRARMEALDPGSVPPLPDSSMGGLGGLGGLGGIGP